MSKRERENTIAAIQADINEAKRVVRGLRSEVDAMAAVATDRRDAPPEVSADVFRYYQKFLLAGHDIHTAKLAKEEDIRAILRDIRAMLQDIRAKEQNLWQHVLPVDRRDAAVDAKYEEGPPIPFAAALEAIRWDTFPLRDYRFGMPFTGRRGFFWETTFFLARLAENALRKPTALVLSTCSGAGKTVSFLELKNFFFQSDFRLVPDFEVCVLRRFPGEQPKPSREELTSMVRRLRPVVVYCGFNTTLSLQPDEETLIRMQGSDAYGCIILRRLVVMAAFSIRYPNKSTEMPPHNIFDGLRFPTRRELTTTLCQLLADTTKLSPTSPRAVIACVDEVQQLDAKYTGLSDLGRIFLRTLRDLQPEMRDLGILLLPFGIGIAASFSEVRNDATNVTLSGGDTVLITKEDYEAVAKAMVPQIKKKGIFVDRDDNAVAHALQVALWPNLRFLSDLAYDGEIALKELPKEMSTRASKLLFEVYKKSLASEFASSVEFGEILEGAGQLLPFEIVSRGTCKLILCPLIAYQLLQAILSTVPGNAGLASLFDRLPVIQEVRAKFEDELIPTRFSKFEDRAFAVLGCALYVGLMIPEKVTALVGGLVVWVKEKAALSIDNSSEILPRSSFLSFLERPSFPFANPTKESFFHVVDAPLDAHVPIFIRGSEQSSADYYFLFPLSGSPNQWVAVVTDAKHSQPPEKTSSVDTTIVTGSNQAQLLRACIELAQAMKAAGHVLLDARLVFVTHRGRLSKPRQAPKEAKTFKGLLPNVPIEFLLLTAENFYFPPFSDLLFPALHSTREVQPSQEMEESA